MSGSMPRATQAVTHAEGGTRDAAEHQVRGGTTSVAWSSAACDRSQRRWVA
jgi:hypothetical protein